MKSSSNSLAKSTVFPQTVTKVYSYTKPPPQKNIKLFFKADLSAWFPLCDVLSVKVGRFGLNLQETLQSTSLWQTVCLFSPNSSCVFFFFTARGLALSSRSELQQVLERRKRLQSDQEEGKHRRSPLEDVLLRRQQKRLEVTTPIHALYSYL